MKSLTSYLITIFVILFWIARLIITFTASIGIDLGIVPWNMNYEIILLFVSLFAMVLVIKRNIIGVLVYFASYVFYFGIDVYNDIQLIINDAFGANLYLSFAMSIFGVVLAISSLIDILFNKNRTNTGKSKKTDWYYKNEEFDRKLDERADKNNYKTM